MARTADPHRRESILQAARATFTERGYAQTRIAEIATRAGVAAGTIYLYFESKEAIVLALCEQHFAGLANATLPALQHNDPARAIREAVHAALIYVTEEHDLLKLTHLDAGLSALDIPMPAKRAYHRALANRLAEWIERGVLPQYDPLILAELIAAMIERAAESCLLYGQGDLGRYEATLIELLSNMLLNQTLEQAQTAHEWSAHKARS